MSLIDRLTKSRLTLVLDFPFFGMLAMRLAFEIDPSVETAETDGTVIRFNPQFCGLLNDRQLTWLLAHEVSHPGLGHLWRIGSRDLDQANRAADYAVNEMLEKVIKSTPGAAARMERIPQTLLNSSYFGLSMEEIYTLLPEPEPGGSSSSSVGTFTKPSASRPQEEGNRPSRPPESLEQEWKAAAIQAATVARMKGRGHLPAELEEVLRELVEPAVPWQDLLRQFASRICRDDYSFRRPNRRFAHQGVMLPSLRSEGLGRLVVAVDTSGSIRCNEKLLTIFLSELQGILDQTAPEAVHLIDCDARVHSDTEFRPGDDLRGSVFRGGGGTSFVPVFRHVEQHELQPVALIYLTDLEGSFPLKPPAYPVLWLNYGNPRSKAPFGDTITVLPT